MATGPRRAATQVRSAAETRLPPGAITIALVTINVIVYLTEIATGERHPGHRR